MFREMHSGATTNFYDKFFGLASTLFHFFNAKSFARIFFDRKMFSRYRLTR